MCAGGCHVMLFGAAPGYVSRGKWGFWGKFGQIRHVEFDGRKRLLNFKDAAEMFPIICTLENSKTHQTSLVKIRLCRLLNLNL